MVWWIVACSGGQPEDVVSPAPANEAALQTVRLALNWYPEPEFGGFYEGVLGGHYAAAGFDVTIIPGGPGAPTLELLAAGQAEAAISAADEASSVPPGESTAALSDAGGGSSVFFRFLPARISSKSDGRLGASGRRA